MPAILHIFMKNIYQDPNVLQSVTAKAHFMIRNVTLLNVMLLLCLSR